MPCWGRNREMGLRQNYVCVRWWITGALLPCRYTTIFATYRFGKVFADFTLSVGFCTSFSHHMRLFSSQFLAPLHVGELIGIVVHHFGIGTPHQFANLKVLCFVGLPGCKDLSLTETGAARIVNRNASSSSHLRSLSILNSQSGIRIFADSWLMMKDSYNHERRVLRHVMSSMPRHATSSGSWRVFIRKCGKSKRQWSNNIYAVHLDQSMALTCWLTCRLHQSSRN